ncbi:MAG: hypothetical protein ACM3TR_05020 [Caulobacteraceae bacterium]
MKKYNSNRENPLEETQKEKENELINVFKYFEEANAKNRAAFSELVEYTYRNKKN